MENRIEEINGVINIIHSLCEKSEITLVPYKTKNGIYVTGVHDNTTNKTYILTLSNSN